MATTGELKSGLHAHQQLGILDNETPLKLENVAGSSSSPYVRGHMNNPVAWQIWNLETLALAEKHNRLLFVSIGYAACHWCHVMERESFMSQEVADLLNKNFIPVKIDREERPDVDAIYMNYVQATTGGGGWPLNVFITPDLEPVFGGTYFPGPGSSNNGIGTVLFVDLLEKLRDIWRNQEDKCRANAKQVTAKLRTFAEEGMHTHHHESGSGQLDLDLLDDAYRLIAHQYDNKHAGFSKAPKFPTPTRLQFLLHLSQWPSPVTDVVGKDECAHAAAMATDTLLNMARGGIRDQIGFGFSRYSVTKDWSLPHFEKMLYDQALLLDVYLDAYLISNQPELLGAIYDIATYLTQEPLYNTTTGGFNSSEDADSLRSHNDTEAHEGAYYIWTYKEILELFPSQQEATIITRFYNIKPHGNISPENDPHDELHNQNVLSIADTPKRIARDLGLSEADVYATLKAARIKLRQHREQTRPRPALDDKVIVSWNGFAIAALARTAAALSVADPTSSKTWLSAALETATFIKTTLWEPSTKTLYRVYRQKRSPIKALADDYAALISASIELYSATHSTSWLQWADTLQSRQNELFLADNGLGYYTTEKPPSSNTTNNNTATNKQPPNPENTSSLLLLHLKQGMDSAEPSSNSLSAQNLFKLGSLLSDESYTAQARNTVAAFEMEMEHYPASFPGLLSAGVWGVVGGKGVVVVGDDENTDGKDRDEAGQDGRKGTLGVDAILARLRCSTGVGRTVLRVSTRDTEGYAWLCQRNGMVREMKLQEEGGGGGGVKILICEGRACREVQRLGDI